MKINHCPWCNSESRLSTIRDIRFGPPPLHSEIVTTLYQARCDTCDAQGPSCQSESSAVSAWNGASSEVSVHVGT